MSVDVVCIFSETAVWYLCFLLVFKQKTAYDIEYGLVGSEMCIRDRVSTELRDLNLIKRSLDDLKLTYREDARYTHIWSCLLYTSDAADERSSVDLGGRRIIKKKNKDESN